MENVLIFGARGYLGRAFQSLYPKAICPGVDIADARAVAEILDCEKPDIVVNAAGKTGRPNIDWCETHKEETLRSNLTGPLVLLEECGKRNIYWVHLSSGCIYEGSRKKVIDACHPEVRAAASHEGRQCAMVRGSATASHLTMTPCGSRRGDTATAGFTESDPPNFFGSFYSRVKGWCDQILREFAEPQDGKGGMLILRLRMPFDGSLNERNLLMKLRKYPRVLDVQNSLTYLPDFLEAAKILIARRRTGIYNIVNPGTISPYEIMMLYKKIAVPRTEPGSGTGVQKDHPVERLTLDDLSNVVRAARSNCVLSTEKLQRERIALPDVHVRVQEALRTLICVSGSS